MHEMTSELQMVLNEIDCTDVIPTGTFLCCTLHVHLRSSSFISKLEDYQVKSKQYV